MNQFMLEGRVRPERDPADKLADEVRRLERQVTTLQSELQDARDRNKSLNTDLDAAEATIHAMQDAFGPMHNALMAVFGKATVPVSGGEVATHSSGSAASDNKKAIWDAWKERLGDGPGKIIDALLLHKSMNTQQLAIATGYNRNTIPQYIYRLKKAGLVNKAGGIYSLKEL